MYTIMYTYIYIYMFSCENSEPGQIEPNNLNRSQPTGPRTKKPLPLDLRSGDQEGVPWEGDPSVLMVK